MKASLKMAYKLGRGQDIPVLFWGWSCSRSVCCLRGDFLTFPLHLSRPSPLSQLQLLHSGVRFWEGAPDRCRVRVAEDVTAEPASAGGCRSPRQWDPGWFLPEPQQQLHQHKERDTVRIHTNDFSASQCFINREFYIASKYCTVTKQPASCLHQHAV